MVDAFATFDDLGTLLNREFTGDEQPWITSLLESASTYLREDVIGAQVFPQASATFTAWPDWAGEVVLPTSPVVSVDSVQRDSVDTAFTFEDGVLRVPGRGACDVMFTYGYANPPEGLKRWACVLVSQALMPLEMKLGLTVGGLSSVAIDDFRVAFADGGDGTGMTLSDANIQRLRDQYGSLSTVVGTR
jgi:hypothetical protein